MALALALSFGVTGLAEAKNAKKPVVHRRVKARKTSAMKARKAKKGQLAKMHRKTA